MPIQINNINYTYMQKTPYEKRALCDINLTIEDGSFVAIAGHTGSGKSTLMQHINGLITPQSGSILVDGVDINQKKSKAALQARQSIGLVFQYPEQQLFEETVQADIAFGPKNYGIEGEALIQRVREAMKFVDLSYEEFKHKSPFMLSGGQMRRVAIAGIIALKPKFLVLDEPTAGLDPRLKSMLLRKIKELNTKHGVTIIMVSHNMDDIAQLADKVAILNQGKLVIYDQPLTVFAQTELVRSAGLLQPEVMQVLQAIKAAGVEVNPLALNRQQAVDNILQALGKRGSNHAK